MMSENEDLGLSLSLNLMSSSRSSYNPHKPSWFETFTTSDRDSETCRGETGSLHLKGIDVNRLPSGVDCEEEAGVSSPNSTVSSVSGKRSEREYNDNERISDEEDAETARKKLRLTKDQSIVLEESFKEHNTLNPKQKMALAKQLGLRARQVEVWFQNRRARTKLKQTEVDCDFLKRCCENLTEENRRLQKEVQTLSAILHANDPSCERVAVPHSAVDVATRHHHMASAQPRQFPVGPWASAASISHRPFDALRPRS